MNSPRGYRPMSCLICKAQCWLSLLTASHVHAVDRTTAGSCAFQWLLGEYFHSLFMGVWQNATVEKVCCNCALIACACVFKRFNAGFSFWWFSVLPDLEFALCALKRRKPPIKSGLCNEFCCLVRMPVCVSDGG